ncbi:glycoprotein [Almendravirus chico]|uniref:glycoprotein n=1 Tax=Almendravirus chico TaxID=1972687 RepID=UPI001E281B51|nr:glycoprotein [Almendravirus chico]
MSYYIFPVILLSAFRPAGLEDVTCPSLNHDHKVDMSEYREYDWGMVDNSILNNDLYSVSGYDCHYVKLTTSCQANLLSKNVITYTKKIINAPIDQCQSLKEDKLAEYPLPQCEWNMFGSSITENSMQYMVTKERTYRLNPVTGNIVNEHIIFDSCSELHCVYKNSKGYFVKKPRSSKIDCSNHNIITVSNMKAATGKVNNHPAIQVMNRTMMIDDVCMIDRCGVKLVYLSDFQIFKVPHELKFKNCEEDHVQIKPEIALFTDLRDSIDCSILVERLLVRKEVKYADIKALHPTSIGINNVYRYKNGTLEVALAYYSRIDKVELMKHSNRWIDCGPKANCSYNGWIEPKERLDSKMLDVKDYEEFVSTIASTITTKLAGSFDQMVEEEISKKVIDSTITGFIQRNWIWAGEIISIIIICVIVFKFIIKSIKKKEDKILYLPSTRSNYY